MDMSNLSDRERHNLLLQKKAQEKKEAEQPKQVVSKVDSQPLQSALRQHSTLSQDVASKNSAQPQRVWACSNCIGCEEFVKGPQPGKCKNCKCDLLYHLKEEEEYGDHCIGKLPQFLSF